MLVFTEFLKRGPVRITSLGNNLHLPRAVQLKTVVGGFAGMIIALALGSPLLAFFGTAALPWLVGVGILGGSAAVSYSPLRGESFTTWARLEAQSRVGRIETEEGERKKVYIGLCPLPWVGVGHVYLLSASAEVQPDWVDAKRAVK